MALMLARVDGAEAARQARAAGVDIVEPASASIGDVAWAALRPLSIRLADQPGDPGRLLKAIAGHAAADFVRVALSPMADDPWLLAMIQAAPRTRMLAVLTPEAAAEPDLLARLKRAGFEGVMIETDAAGPSRLLDAMTLPAIDAFVHAARDLGLTIGLSGGLEAPDLPRLTPLEPDLIGFDLTAGGDATVDVDAIALLARLCRRDAAAAQAGAPTDLVFIRDFVQEMEVGAYASERGRRQRVRFTIEASVARPDGRAQTMAEIYSYDLMMDAVRVLAARRHADFVETIAEDLAATILADPRVAATLVRIEKLDLGPEAAGVEIRRTRA